MKNEQTLNHNFILPGFLMALTVTCYAQEAELSGSICQIQDSVLIPVKSGIDISATILRKQNNSGPLPVILFYTTYYQGKGDSFFAKLSAVRDYAGVIAYARGIRTDIHCQA